MAPWDAWRRSRRLVGWPNLRSADDAGLHRDSLLNIGRGPRVFPGPFRELSLAVSVAPGGATPPTARPPATQPQDGRPYLAARVAPVQETVPWPHPLNSRFAERWT